MLDWALWASLAAALAAAAISALIVKDPESTAAFISSNSLVSSSNWAFRSASSSEVKDSLVDIVLMIEVTLAMIAST